MLSSRLLSSSASVLRRGGLHPLLLVQSRRHASSTVIALLHHRQHPLITSTTFQRWSQNFSRLYARRMLEMAAIAAAAAAAAASHTKKTQAEMLQRAPTQWLNWREDDRHDWTQDLLETTGRNSLERYMTAAWRLCNLTALASPLLILMPLSYIDDKNISSLYWDYCLWGIEQAGPTFIKLVQWATTRQDMFSPEFCNHFGKLRDQTKGHSWRETHTILQRELGPNYEAEVVKIVKKDKPIGSGCIAQVYEGTLQKQMDEHAKGTKVAVKVQHPRIMEKVCADFYILGKLASFLESIPYFSLEYLSLRDTVDQFCSTMLPQLDLTLEAENLRRFTKDFVADSQVHFPQPIVTSSQVLVETYCEGKPILHFSKSSLAVRKALATLGLQTTLKMIFLHDFVHGDLQ